MALRDWIQALLTAGIILALMRFVPLAGPRRLGVVLLRAAGIVGVLLALKGWSWPQASERPRHLVYLVDTSKSIEPSAVEWAARRVCALEALRPAPIPRTVMAFGEDAHVALPASRAALRDPAKIADALTSAPVNREATNLEAALLSTLAVVPPGEPSRVILLSDGRQTQGTVERVLPHLRRFGVEVYPVPVSSAAPAEVTWEQLVLPPTIPQGASVPINLVFVNGTSRTQAVDVTVRMQELSVARRRVPVRPGWQVAPLAVPALKTGTMRVDVEVRVPGDAAPQRKTGYVEVEGPPRVRVVLDKPTELPPLVTALKRRHITVSVSRPQELPTEAGRLLEEDVVLLFQVPKSAFTEEQVRALEEYVQRYGGGVVMVGLGGVLSQEIMQQHPLDALLPVRFEPKGLQESTRRVCIVMLIDRSASMMGPRIAATKRAAVELVKQLSAEDLVGVLAFDVRPYVVVEVQPAGRVTEALIEKLVRLKSTGGTDIFPALEAARDRLTASDATVKHILLLSDGNTPFNAQQYRGLLEEFAQQRITLSAIGIGSAFVNVNLLDWMAKKSGGTFYQMTNLDELPQLIARDTQKELGRLPFTEGHFRPRRAESSEWFSDFSGWPPLKGYLTTTAKPAARVELELPQAESAEPLLAFWDRGAGRVAVFTSDGGARWCPDWIRWPEFESVWAQIIQQAMRQRTLEGLFAWLDQQDGVPQLIIEGDLADPAAELVSSDGTTTIPLALVQSSRFRWRAQVGHVDSGWYRLVVESHQAEASAFARRWIQVGRADHGPEQPNLPPDERLLRHIAQETRGVYDVPDAAFLPPTERVERRVPLRGWLLPLVILLLLGDVALRGRTML